MPSRRLIRNVVRTLQFCSTGEVAHHNPVAGTPFQGG